MIMYDDERSLVFEYLKMYRVIHSLNIAGPGVQEEIWKYTHYNGHTRLNRGYTDNRGGEKCGV